MDLKVGGPFELFAGNVRGETVEVDVAKKLVQTWQTRSPQWPSGGCGGVSSPTTHYPPSTIASIVLASFRLVLLCPRCIGRPC